MQEHGIACPSYKLQHYAKAGPYIPWLSLLGSYTGLGRKLLKRRALSGIISVVGIASQWYYVWAAVFLKGVAGVENQSGSPQEGFVVHSGMGSNKHYRIGFF